MTQIKHVAPAPGLEVLEQLVGKWHTEGELLEGPFGAPAPFVAVETYEWLEGGHFLIHRVDGRFGSRSAACIEIFGREEEKLVARSYYDDGERRAWTLSPRTRVLELSGAAQGQGSEPHDVRCELRVVEEGNALEARWSHKQAGNEWRVFLETRGTKAQPLPNASVGG